MKNKYKILFLLIILIFISFIINIYRKNNSKEFYITSIPNNIKLSKDEKEVNYYLSKIKKEADKLYTSTQTYGIIDWNDTIYSQELLDFSSALPKGGDLHIHADKAISVSNLINLLLQYNNVSIVLDKGSQYGNLYVGESPKNAVSLKQAIDSKKITLDELKEIIVLSDEDTNDGRWENFKKVQRNVNRLHEDSELTRLLYEESFRSSCENKACLLEIRVSFSTKDEMNINTIKTIRDAYYNVKDEYPQLVVRVIASPRKNYKIEENMNINIFSSAIRLSKIIKDEYDSNNIKNFIIGIDLAGYEDERLPLEEYRKLLSSKEVQNSGLKLFLHAGESLRIDNNSVIDAYLLNSTRVGHAFNLYRFPKLMKKYSNEKIAVEVSLMSNYRLGYVHDIRIHPALMYLQNGIPIVLSSDDGLFFAEEPLVYDYYAAILAWDLDLATIKQMSLNNIIYSGLSDDEIEILKNNWDKDWNDFISDMLKII